MALNRYVLTATVTIAAGTAIATPTAGEPATGGAAGFGNAGISAGFAPWPQTFTEGTAIVLDPAGGCSPRSVPGTCAPTPRARTT